jgi:transposase-like protein
MKRRKWKPEQKALIVLEGLKGRPIGELCAEHEISQAQYYQWREAELQAEVARWLEQAAGAAGAGAGDPDRGARDAGGAVSLRRRALSCHSL